MLSDGILQSIGYVLLGNAISRRPEINKKEHYVSVDFSADNNADFQKYTLDAQHVGDYPMTALVEEYDKIVDAIGVQVALCVESSKMVAGTLRIHLNIINAARLYPMVSIMLMWAEEKQ